jgi:Txe/YoeB family toxin of Txe-Axe toxin-antitoxin module
MNIKPLKNEVQDYIKNHQLVKKFEKAKRLFEQDENHPTLNVEVLEPKHLKIYSFGLDRQYRVIFIVVNGEAEVITVTNHYQ